MRRILTISLVGYWAVFFAILAGASTVGAGQGPLVAFRFIGVAEDALPLASAPVAALLALECAVVAVLLVWAMVACVIGARGEETDVAATGFGAAALALCTMLIAGEVLDIEGASRALALQLAAMTASYLAIQVERRRATALEGPASDAIPAVQVLPFAGRHRIGGAGTGESR